MGFKKKYKAEILSLSEERYYWALCVEDAADLAAEEFGMDDIGRVYEVRA